jgi:hypothetical protein
MKSRYLLILSTALVAFFISVYSTNKPTETSGNGLLFRKIGHELLRSSGDDSSRVMPVKQLSSNQFQIRFENPLSLLPDSIISIVNTVLKTSTLPPDYMVSVIDCASKENVYGFARAAIEKNSIVSCQGRALPKGCYFIDISFVSNDTTIPSAVYIISGVVLLFAGLLTTFYFYRKNKKTTIPGNEPAPDNSTHIRIGQTIFNTEQHYLEFEGVKTTLTNKESKLLYIFSGSINEMIDRNTLQKEVWENEGVIVTRSLDMFISKLRKKLAADASVKIVNFPGKGYKLEV